MTPGTMTAGTRSWWGWGIRGPGDQRRRAAPGSPPFGRALRPDDIEIDARRWIGSTCVRRGSRRRTPSPSGARRQLANGRAHLRQVVPRRRARVHGDLPTRPTSSPSPLPRRTSSPCSTGAPAGRRGDPLRRRLVGGRRRRGVVDDAFAGRSRSISRGSTGCSRSTGSRGRPASRPARSARRSRTSSGRTGYTLRHFPQSFEFSTLGGWLATRSGGHYATVYTHIDDLVESMRWSRRRGSASRRLPGSGAGPSPGPPVPRLRGQRSASSPRPGCGCRTGRAGKASAGVTSPTSPARSAGEAVAQSGLFPTNCRLLDGAEAATRRRADDRRPARARVRVRRPSGRARGWRAVELCRDHGGDVPEWRHLVGRLRQQPTAADDAVGAWRSAFLRAPYQRDALARCRDRSRRSRPPAPGTRFAALHAGVVATGRRGSSGSAAAAG